MARPEEYSRERMIEAVRKGKGKTGAIANMLGCTPATIRNYAKRYKTVENAITEARYDFGEGLVDRAEMRLEQAVDNSEAWAIRLVVTTKGKDRGYVERQEVTGADGESITINFVWKDSGIS